MYIMYHIEGGLSNEERTYYVRGKIYLLHSSMLTSHGQMTKPKRAKREQSIRTSIIDVLQSEVFKVGYHRQHTREEREKENDDNIEGRYEHWISLMVARMA